MKIKLGQKVRDVITGFEGIAIGRTEYLFGCVHIGVKTQKLHDGKTIEASWFEEPQLEVVEKKTIMEAKTDTGGPSLHGHGGRL